MIGGRAQTCQTFFNRLHLGLLQSVLVDNDSMRGQPVQSAPPVVQLNFRHVRGELPDEDIRRVAFNKLRDGLLQDPLATQLGVSVKTMLDGGCHPSIA